MSANLAVADAGPLHYLILTDCADILPRLFNHVLIPTAVRDELIHARAPKKVRDWISAAPAWLEVTQPQSPQAVRGLHRGEAEVLQLALEKHTDVVLMDDMDGRAAARRLGINPIFTVALMELAAEKGFLDLPDALAKLRSTSFFISGEILDGVLERDKARKARPGTA